MLDIREWKWEKVKAKDKTEKTFCCPYCNITVSVTSDTRIVDVDTGGIKYNIFKCLKCHMPVTIGIDGEIIPPSRFLPFEDIRYLPERIEKMYFECRKSFVHGCFYSVIMLARTMIMHIAANLGADSNLRFIEYIRYLTDKGHISQSNLTWVDIIRKLGNRYIHELDEATEEDASLVMVFISHLLKSIYELPEMANRRGMNGD